MVLCVPRIALWRAACVCWTLHVLGGLSRAWAAADPLDEEWYNYVSRYNKTFSSAYEQLLRREFWKETRARVQHHNENVDSHTYTMATNRFADLDPGERRRFLSTLGFNSSRVAGGGTVRRQRDVTSALAHFSALYSALPREVNWVERGAVTAVMNQGVCGACYAFAAIATLEGAHFISNGTLTALSEQNIIDCSQEQGNSGCEGGLMTNVYNYVRDAGGVDTERYYPYTNQDSVDAGACRYDDAEVGATCSGHVSLPEGDEAVLQHALAMTGPVACGLSATENLLLYSSGVFWDPDCGSSSGDLNHAAAIVGYGTEMGQDYWLLKNSWGADWGESGFVRIARNQNMCGIATYCQYPVD